MPLSGREKRSNISCLIRQLKASLIICESLATAVASQAEIRLATIIAWLQSSPRAARRGSAGRPIASEIGLTSVTRRRFATAAAKAVASSSPVGPAASGPTQTKSLKFSTHRPRRETSKSRRIRLFFGRSGRIAHILSGAAKVEFAARPVIVAPCKRCFERPRGMSLLPSFCGA